MPDIVQFSSLSPSSTFSLIFFAKLLPFQRKKIQWNYITCLCNSFHCLVPLCSLHFQPLQSHCQNSCRLTSASSFHSPWSPCAGFSCVSSPFYSVRGLICFWLNLLSKQKIGRKAEYLHRFIRMHSFKEHEGNMCTKQAGITHFTSKWKDARCKHGLEHADKQTCRMWHTAVASRPNICCHMYYFSCTPVCRWDARIASWTPTSASLTSAQCLFRGQPVSLHVLNMHAHMCTYAYTSNICYFSYHMLLLLSYT